MNHTRPQILFLCTGNSCRSQMAEGWTRALHPHRYAAHSAGLQAHGLNPHAVEVMREAGVDITRQLSQRLDELALEDLDLVITVCGHADENCPSLPVGCKKLHAPFDDPPSLSRQATTEEEALEHYRRVRDEIREFVVRLPEVLADCSLRDESPRNC